MPHPFITRLHLTNYRCFPELEISFYERLTVLIAPNGAGKTSILDAIAVALGPFIGSFDEAHGTGFEANDIRQSQVRRTAGNEMEYAAGGVSLEAHGFIPFLRVNQRGKDGEWKETPATWRRSLAGPTKAKTTIKEAKQLVETGKRLQIAVRTPGQEVILPVVSYYGTGRLWQLKKLTLAKLPRTSRTIGYSDCLDSGSSYKAFAEWFRYWSNSAMEKRFAAIKRNQNSEPSEFDSYIESVSKAVNICLEPSGWKNIEYSMARQEMVAHHDEHGELPVSLLSDGIRNMIGMVADIAFRATKLNPQLGAQASSKSPGIVLIDEVDMHLHPEWQQLVLDSLTRAFPLIQFIVTTHSPQVLTTVKAESIRGLKYIDGKVIVKSDYQFSEGAEAQLVLEDILGVSPRPQDLKVVKQLNAYLDLVATDQWDTPTAAELREKLDEWGRGHESALLKADMDIRMRQYRRKQGNA